MNTLWRKAIRDLFGERLRSVGVVVALALGIAGFLAVLSAYPIITRALNDGYLTTNPPSATLAVDRLDDDDVRAIAAMPGIEGAEARRTVRGRMKAGSAPSQNLTLFVRRDFETSRIGAIRSERGAWPPRLGEMVIERDALQVARAQVGDVVTVRTQNGGPRSLRVIGSVHDVGQAQARMENIVYGYVTLETLATLGEEPFYDELAIRVAERPLDEGHIHDVASSVKQTLEKSGHLVARVDVPEPGEHPHAKLMGMVSLSLAVFGFFVLALSGVIVFNLLTALLAGQRRQIGVMAAIGGTRLQIARVYLVEAGLLGVAAIASSLPIGVLGGRWICLWMAGFLNFDIVSFAIPLWIYALVFAAGVAVPVVAAAVPVWLATRVPVRVALASSNSLGRTYGTSFVDRALSSVGGVSRVLLLAIRNVGRNRARVALTLAMLTIGGVFFMSALNLRQSMIAAVDRIYETSAKADLSISLASDYPSDVALRAARRVTGVTVAEAWNVIKGGTSQTVTEIGHAYSAKEDEVTIIGLPPASQLMTFDLSSGKGLDGDARSLVASTSLYDKLGKPPLGAEVHILVEGKDTPLRLAGVALAPFSLPTAYVSRAFFDTRPQAGSTNALRLSLSRDTPELLDAAKVAIEESLDREGIRIAQASTKAQSRYAFDAHMVMIYVLLIALSCILGGVGTIGLVIAVSLNVSERRREMGVLRAMGATPARVAQIVIIEGMVVGALAWLLSTVAVMPLGKVIGDLMLRWLLRAQSEIPIAIEAKGIAIWFVVALGGSALATLWSARQAARASVREALTYE
jgi:putative ABC transport system permease protein